MSILHDARTTIRRSSELSKHSADVFAEAEEHPVQVTRRDGETLVLMSQSAADAQAQLLQLAADLITVTLDDEGSLASRMAQRFPWMLALSAADQESCARELVDAARASFSTGQPHLAIAELTSWRETATAIAAGLAPSPVEWLDRPVPVARP
ncbi:prevent-host-death protein [Clavibacter sp. CT19]|uniref:prevent-host-death protein n=1 Tax=Clavibacter sp. CT19 TaxID=3018990 RepID=UPI0022EAAC04|nr:prevent-host-death protein [Clavibacter sp. CT19]MDA3804849.1 prevent-host-death protein [Clavibacter sp. CT19]